MNVTDIILINLKEIRRRSIKVWEAIPEDKLDWNPDKGAMPCLEMISTFSEEDLTTIQIDRSDVGYVRSLGDMLMRIGYHESVHAGQLLQYLRIMGVDRPRIWD
ncbi:DinB family protein [Priestia megaterium]|jgi:hypothetical protein|uniref:DinB family protein n=1 Tax=Priestia megaterium TaxID=1404 RepID=UPI000BA78852|nr:hypothetical protein [Priestia megaterium]PAK50578.1 hypothetical protein CHH47_10645 [Priestia megaterium]QSF40938.1 hypothetical protein ICR96_09825 [Priestia megaterium]